ncbi:MAG: metal-binding protein [Lachnospiraceae bacterium]|nr:metal-binding protein [Lachnospiraceae bacterium]MBP5746015.1 metal-binding protein [Lachnospiraceae bacterium]
MENNARFFANKECEFYPCHKCAEDINCLFCFCPLYDRDCPGNYKMTEKNGKLIKSCIDCVFPHIPGNYDKIMSMLKS